MKNPFEYFDKIYCVNLKERTDRWKECLDNFEKFGIKNCTRLDAVKINADIHPKRKGQIGCSLSYAMCINKAINENLKNVLILEDDFEFALQKEDLHKRINATIKELPDNWDSLYFGGTIGNFYGKEPIEKYSPNLFKLNCAHTTHSIAFSYQGLRKIVKLFDNNLEWHQKLIENYECIDVFLAKEFLPNSNSFISSDLLCYQRVSQSDIENTTYDYSHWMNHNFNQYKSKILNE
jgi:GR25 family glycosyltransferase involved in LPS biosynthesis